MANWYGMTRSSLFRVKDEDAFQSYMALFDAKVFRSDKIGSENLWGFYSETEYGDLPEIMFEDIDEDYASMIEYVVGQPVSEMGESISVLSFLGHYLADGEVVYVLEVGNEKARYVSAHAWAVFSDGRVEHVSLVEAVQSLASERFGVDRALHF